MTVITENSKDDSSVRVALRVRPQSAAEKIDMCRVCTSVLEDSPQIVLGKDKSFTYDYVFDTGSQQDEIYGNVASELIEGCFDGYNATILAYGQTGSGKTYTMGTAFDASNSLGPEQVGIIPRAIKHLFDGIHSRKQKAIEENRPPPEFKIQAQFMELYNEEIIDLIDIESKGRKLVKIHEDSNGNIYTTGIMMRSVSSEKDIMKLLEDGALSRTTASTNMNATSSRSHAIFTVHLKHHRMAKIDESSEDANEENQGEEFETLTAKFNFVDLAGSERLKRTGATGDRAKEGISINQGLLSLGNVISALGDSTKRGCHVPYRDSKLTRLLQDSLGGNSRTIMIACVSPSDRDFMETLNTLKYANRARNIKNKVVVNQDKASKQIAALRNEIQGLQIELLEYKQGKRVADGEGGDHMSDVFHENTMLHSENENLRLRMKALQETIDSQTQQISELKAAAVLGGIKGETDIEVLVVGYVKEIEELSNKLLQSEAMSSAAVKRARAISRVAMSPGTPEDETVSLIELAKQDLKRDKKRMRKEKHHKHHPSSIVKESSFLNDAHDEEKDTNKDENEKDKHEIVDADHVEEELKEDENEELAHDDDDDDDDDDRSVNSDDDNDEDEGSGDENEDDDDDDDDDDAISLAESSIHEEALREDIADLSTEITIKQKLVEELEHSQKRLTVLKQQYEDKMALLQTKIKETEEERDKVLKNIGTVDSKAAVKANEIRVKYEKKLVSMQKELSKLQSAKREHGRLIKAKEQNEQQLKALRNELGDLKKIKVKLMRQMRDEVSKAKQREGKFSTQLEQMIKENRKRDIQIKHLKQDQKQKDMILKRKQEELNSMRKQIKPVSGNVGRKKKQDEDKLRQNTTHNGPMSHDEPRKRIAARTKSPQRDPHQKPPFTPKKSPAVTRNAKKKWEMLERKMNDLMLKMKTVANMENDMERWLQDRDRISKQLEGCQKKKEEALRMKRDESLIQEFTEQHEALTAQMDYIQENITESQSTIMEMEDIGEMINSSEIMRGCSLSEARYMLEHFYGKSIELGQELANKDAAYKELEMRLEAIEQHCEVQQQLLQHVFVEKHFGEAGGDDEYQGNIGDDIMAENGLEVHPHLRRISNKARRRTGCPEDFLKPAIRLQASTGNDNAVKEQLLESKASGDNLRKGSDTPEVNSALMQKLMEIDKASKKKDKKEVDSKLMPPPSLPRGPSNSSQTTEPRSRSLLQTVTDSRTKTLNNNNERKNRSASFGSTGSLNEVANSGNETLPASFQRGNRVSKSARTFMSKMSSAAQTSQPLSANNSPKQLRKTLSEDDKGSHPQSNNPGSRVNTRGETLNDLNKNAQRLVKTSRSNTSKAESNEIDKTTPRIDVDSADVFTRLTSNLPQEADPDLGQMLPVKAPTGRPENLMCTHTATGHNNAVLSLAVTEDILITGSKDRTAKIWDLNRGDEILSLAGHKRDVTVVRYSPVTKLVFTVNQSTIKIWDIRQNTGTCVKTLSGNFFQLGDSSIMDLGLNYDGTILYSAVGNTVKMVDLKTYGTVGKLSGHSGAVTCLLVTQGERRGDICVTGSKDHYIKVFEVLSDVSGSQEVKPTKISKNGIDKNYLSSLMPRHNLEPPHYDGVQSLAIQDNTLFSGSRDNSIKKWNLNNHQLKHHITTAHKDWVCSLNIIRNYDVLISGCRSGLLKLWHSGSCSQLGEINAHSRAINAIAINKSHLFTASSDRLVRIWKPTSTLDEHVQGVSSSLT